MKKSILRITVLVLISLFVIGNGVMAAGGNGNGSGGGSDEPLSLESSSVSNGATGVAKDVKITLTFSKNVTFDTVRSGNEKAFSMVDQDGKNVAINVILADSSNDSEKNNVVIKPVNALEEGNKYTLTISGSLESKSGATLGSSQKITFSTVEKSTETTKVTASNTSTTNTSSKNSSNTTVTNPKTGDEININILLFLASTCLICGYMSIKSYKKRIN